jgi:hypothetical protein
MPNPVSEADLIEAAYEDQVKVLFKTLFTGLEDGGSNPSSGVEQQCLQHFNLGLRLARRARELALSALTAPAAKSPGADAPAATLLAMAAPPMAAPGPDSTSSEKKTKRRARSPKRPASLGGSIVE